MKQNQPPIGPCKLCGTVGILQYSHIVSRWGYRRLVNTPSGPHNPVAVDGDVAILSGKQAAEYMLCRPCEERIGDREKYVSTIAVDAAGAFPAVQQSRPVYVHDSEWKVADASSLDCDAIAYFAASVIWRASISDVFSRVTLGSYESRLGAYLLGVAPFPSGVLLIVEFMQPVSGPRVDRLIVEPESQRHAGYHHHAFTMFGMLFRLLVGNVLPDGVKAFSFVDNKVVLLSNGTELLTSVVTRAKAVAPKGALARRQRTP